MNYIVVGGNDLIQKHYYVFEDNIQNKFDGEQLNKNNWDLLRMDDNPSPFSIENSIDDYEKNCNKYEKYKEIASIILSNIEKDDSIISLGSGKAILEYHIKKQDPSIHIECTDYTVDSIERLKKVFVSLDSSYTFDILSGDYSKLNNDSIILLNRISTEFTREQWYGIFSNLYANDFKKIIFIPTGLDTALTMLHEKFLHFRNKIIGKKDIFCGWLYSEKEFIKMFSRGSNNNLYNISLRVPIDESAIYFLEINSSSGVV